MKIIIVSDDTSFLQQASAILTRSSYELARLRLAELHGSTKNSAPDLVLFDVGNRSRTVLAEAESLALRHPQVAILLVCEKPTPEFLLDAMRAGSIADVWNARFGIYKDTDTPQKSQPDFTGFVFNAKTWPAKKQAFDHNNSITNDFMEQRAKFSHCGASVKTCESASGLKLNAKTMASAAELRQYGGNRRIAPVPVVDGANKVVDFACMLMLQPIETPMADVQLEYLGNASEPGSPCIASGLPGGSAGPLVPVLVL